MAVERLRLPPDSPLVGKTLAATGLRTQTGALVLAVARGADEIATPGPHFRLAADDVLVVVGQPPQLRAAARLVTVDHVAPAPPEGSPAVASAQPEYMPKTYGNWTLSRECV